MTVKPILAPSPHLLYECNVVYAVSYADLAFTVAAIQYCLFTLALERRVVWHAPRSFAKFAFLVVKYLPILDGMLVFAPLSSFGRCQRTSTDDHWMFGTFMVTLTFALALNNCLAAWHVVKLWDYPPRLVRAVCAVLITVYTISFVVILLSLSRFGRNSLMAIAAAPPFVLELGLLLLVCWSTLARSRATSEPLLAAFVRDGALSFLVIVMMRAVQLGLALPGDPALTMLSVVALAPTWFVSTAFNLRFLAAQREREREHTGPGDSVVNLHEVILAGREGLEAKRAHTLWGMGADVELGRVEVELHKD